VFALQDELARQIGTQLGKAACGVSAAMPAAARAIDRGLRRVPEGRALYRVRTTCRRCAISRARASLRPEFGAAGPRSRSRTKSCTGPRTEASAAQVGDSYARCAAAERATALEPDAAMTLHAPRQRGARAQGRLSRRADLYRIDRRRATSDVREDYAELLVGPASSRTASRDPRAAAGSIPSRL
jgi:hypothetical protein